MKAIIEEGSPETGQKMQMLALAEGAVPIHLVKALYIKSEDNRLLMQRQLSRHLISLWTADNDAAMELLKRILVSPNKMLHYKLSHILSKSFFDQYYTIITSPLFYSS